MVRRCSRRDALQEPGQHVTREDIRRFAGGFDPQPYLDEAAAERSPLKGLAASGWHTAAMVIRRALDARPSGRIRCWALGRMICAGSSRSASDVIHIEGGVIEVTPSRSRPQGL